jgi:hypothetical protein
VAPPKEKRSAAFVPKSKKLLLHGDNSLAARHFLIPQPGLAVTENGAQETHEGVKCPGRGHAAGAAQAERHRQPLPPCLRFDHLAKGFVS